MEEVLKGPQPLLLGCRTMGDGVVVPAILFVAAILMFLAARHVVPPAAHLQQVVMPLALILIVLARVVLVSICLLSVLPGAREKLDKCEP